MKEPQKINFTKKALAELPAPEKGRTTVYDTAVNGLLVRITSKGTKSLEVRKSVKGHSQRIVLGRFPNLTVQQAREKALAELAQIATNHKTSNQVKEEKRKHEGLTLAKAFDDYLTSHHITT
jgi:hypothetical protein